MSLSVFVIELIFLLLFNSCGSQLTKPENQIEMGIASQQRLVRVETKATVKDLKSNKTHKVSIDMLCLGHEKLRAEVSALLGYPVATLLFDNIFVKYAVYPQKKFYRIKNLAASLEKILKVPLQPSQLLNIVYDQPLDGENWTCTKNLATSRVEKCNHNKLNMTIDFTYGIGSYKKLLKISSPEIEMDWVFLAPPTEVPLNTQAFVLEPKDGFEIIEN